MVVEAPKPLIAYRIDPVLEQEHVLDALRVIKEGLQLTTEDSNKLQEREQVLIEGYTFTDPRNPYQRLLSHLKSRGVSWADLRGVPIRGLAVVRSNAVHKTYTRLTGVAVVRYRNSLDMFFTSHDDSRSQWCSWAEFLESGAFTIQGNVQDAFAQAKSVVDTNVLYQGEERIRDVSNFQGDVLFGSRRAFAVRLD